MADQPGYTRLPNHIIEAMPSLGNGELRVLLAIARKTIGYQKERDRISVSQIKDMTGMTRRNTHKAIQSLVERGMIGQVKVGAQSFEYEITTVSLGDTDHNRIPSDTSTLGDTVPLPVGIRLEQKPYPLGTPQKKESNVKKEKRESTRARTPPPPPKQTSMSSFSEPVQIYKELTGVKSLEPAKADKIAEVVIDCQHWRVAIDRWIGAGNRKENTDGMLDWYLDPSRMERKTNGHTRNGYKQPTNATIPDRPVSRGQADFERAYLERLEREAADLPDLP